MSVLAQIARLEKAKADISAAIVAKGVDVPDGITLDGMAALIEKICVDDEKSRIIVTVASGSTVTCTNGTVTKTAISNGTVIFKSLDIGTWKLTATLGKEITGKTVEINIFQIYYVTMPYTADYPFDYPYDYAQSC